MVLCSGVQGRDPAAAAQPFQGSASPAEKSLARIVGEWGAVTGTPLSLSAGFSGTPLKPGCITDPGSS